MSDTSNKRRLADLDWENLFLSESVEIGNIKVDISPMGFKQLSMAVKQLQTVAGELAEEGITFDNYESPANLAKLATIVMDRVPSLLSDASDIHQDDLDRLPPAEIMNIISKVVEVNLKSKDALLKNFERLAGSLNDLIPSPSEA